MSMLLIYIVFSIFTFALSDKTLIMIDEIIGLFLVFNIARFSYFTVLTFLNVFTLFQEFYLDVFGITTGMLKTGKEAPNAFFELSICTSIFIIIELFFLCSTNMLAVEKSLYRKELFDTKWSVIFRIVSFFLTLLIFPTIPTFKTNVGHRFDSGILPFSGFAGLTFFLLAISFNNQIKKKYYLFDFFSVFWFIGHAERIEAMGYLCYVLLRYLNKNDTSNLSIWKIIKKFYKLILIVLGSLIFLVWIGLTRGGGENNFKITFLIERLFIQSTACDVAYVFNCTVDLAKNKGLLFGKTYLGHISNLIPFIPNNFDISEVIMKNYYTVGGCPFFGECVANFGIVGVAPLMMMYFYLNSFFLKKDSKFRFLFWVPISMMSFRTAWYGWTSWYTLSFVVAPIIYIIYKCILKKIILPNIILKN